LRTKYCERCPDEDTNRCNTCNGKGNDILQDKLAQILNTERERIESSQNETRTLDV
jgi:hypothetical protein